MEDDEIMQEPGTEEDSFLAGWEEDTPSAGTEEDGEAGDRSAGDQGAQEEPAEGGEHEETGADQAGEEGTPQDAEGSGERAETGADPAGDVRQGDAETAGTETGADQAARQQEPRTWTLNHLGQAVTANEADMVVLAQKGLDYDRIRGEYDAAKPVMAMFRDFAGKAGMDVPAYLAYIRAQAKQAEGLSEAEARRAVELEDREAVVAARERVRQQQEAAEQQEAARRQSEEARRQADIREFSEIFPEAARDPQSIPPEVWEQVRGGRSLVAAYAGYSAGKARAAAEEAGRLEAARRQNAENAARSAGSMRSAGANTRKDAFLEGWDDET